MVDFLEPVWDHPRPEPVQIERMWEEIEISCKEHLSDPLAALKIDLENKTYDGKIAIAECTLPEHKTLQWFASRNRLLEEGFFFKLLQTQSVQNTLSVGDELKPFAQARQTEGALADRNEEQPPTEEQEDATIIELAHPIMLRDELGFEFEDPFIAVGRLASMIHSPGPYYKPSKEEGAAAMQLAITVADAAFGQRYNESSVYVSFKPWASWFYGIAWDTSIVMIDNRARKMTIILVTDTD